MGSESQSFRRVTFEREDGVIAGVAWGDPTRPPDILFLHATGLNALAYRSLLEPLADRFHVLAIDLRGHGRTSLPPRLFGYASWNRHRDDVIAVIEHHIKAPVTLAGHSMGGTTGLLVAGRRPDLVRGLAMIDPVVRKSASGLAHIPGFPLIFAMLLPIARTTAKRTNRFSSREEAADAYTGRGIFRSFSRVQIEDYVADGLKEDGEAFTLACAPAFESRTYVAQRHDAWRALVRAPAPLVCLRAETRSTMPAAAAERFAALRPDARIAFVEGASHMLPFERPDRARAAIEAAAVMARARYRDID